MSRSEAKFVCHVNTLLEMLPRLREVYFVLEIDGGRAMGYRSLYLDTPDFGLYMVHHNGKPSRYKVRYRHYLHTDTVFFEVKVREKGKTCKERVKLESDSDWSRNLPKDFSRHNDHSSSMCLNQNSRFGAVGSQWLASIPQNV